MGWYPPLHQCLTLIDYQNLNVINMGIMPDFNIMIIYGDIYGIYHCRCLHTLDSHMNILVVAILKIKLGV